MKSNANRWSSLKRWVGAGGIFVAVFFAAGTLNPGALRADSHDDDRDGNRHDFVQTNLVSDISGLAKITDSQLVNPWGVSHLATSPFWTSNQGTNTATLYAVTNGTNVNKVPINPPSGVVLIPLTSGGPQGPTGQVSNSNAASFPLEKWWRWRVCAFHLRQFEWNHFGLGRRADGFCASHDRRGRVHRADD
jgi:hypothetical protein